MIEVPSWFAITLAKLQEIPICRAIGPSSVPAGGKLICLLIPEQIRMCNSQIYSALKERHHSPFLVSESFSLRYFVSLSQPFP